MVLAALGLGGVPLQPSQSLSSDLTTADQALPSTYAWLLDASAPRLVLPPKCGTNSMVDFINACSGGRVSPKQLVCALDECPISIFFPDAWRPRGPIVRGGFAHVHEQSIPRHGERAYGVMRHPVDRLVSFLNYHMYLEDANVSMQNSTIAEVIDNSSDQELGGHTKHPFDSLHDYLGADGTTILCSLDEFASYVRRNLSFTGCPKAMPHSNRSPHAHGDPRPDQVERIARLLHRDMVLWDEHCGGRDAW